MMNLPAILIGSLIAATAPEAQPETTPAARQALSSAAGKALQGDMEQALDLLESVPENAFGSAHRATRACMLSRFRAQAPEAPPAGLGAGAAQAIDLFRAYWRASLLDPESRPREEDRLYRNLGQLTGVPEGSPTDRIEEAVKALLASEGLTALMGRVQPLLELIVWAEERRENRTVALPEQEHQVEVRLLDRFASLGWSAYATCERSFTGGWVGSDAIYAVVPGWSSLEEENFQVSFLAHETQHFADKARFGDILTWELEYRGKLAELALARTTVPRLLAAFASNQGDDPDVPHSYANRRLLAELRRALGIAPDADISTRALADINEAALALLVEDSRRRTSRSEQSSED